MQYPVEYTYKIYYYLCCCVLAAFAMLLLIIVGCVAGVVEAVTDFPFRNISLSWEDRVDDLVNRLTLQEKVDQMAFGGGGSGKPVPAIQRLGIGPYQFDTECLHGVMGMKSTSFPQAIGLSASFR